MEATTATYSTPATTQEGDQPSVVKGHQDQIERIIYLASLASRVEDIDPMMETLRSVTSTWDQSTPLGSESLRQLQELEDELKNYLITKDPVRSFTAESLEAQLANRTHEGVKRYNLFSPLRILGVSLLAASVPFVLPSDWLPQQTPMFLAIPLFFLVLQIGISGLFLSALKNFQQEVRKAFQVICVGIMLFALSFSHYAIISAFSLDNHPAFQFGGLPLLVSLPFIFIFAGLRIYAKQLRIRSKLASVLQSWVLVAGAMVAVACLYLFVPLFKGPIDSGWYGDFSAITGAMLWLFAGLGAILALEIRKVVTHAYARPLTWLVVYLALTGMASLYSSLSFGSGSVDGEVPFYLFMAVGGIPMQLLLLWTGYSFKKELSK